MKEKKISHISIQVSIQASIDDVWNYWTQPEHITKWNFATDEWHCPKAKNDLKPNGSFSWRMEAKDGSMGFDFTGNYEEIIDKKLITYKMSDGRFVEIEFTIKDKDVILKETFETEGTNTDEQQRTGWLAILKNFKTYVELSTK
ncbi:MAG: SRPBCC domain-containing protein [Flavobacteriales bacterium]|nr:SRPBCC domain-containing protein [Flavobacteriales bacterium]